MTKWTLRKCQQTETSFSLDKQLVTPYRTMHTDGQMARDSDGSHPKTGHGDQLKSCIKNKSVTDRSRSGERPRGGVSDAIAMAKSSRCIE